MQPPTFSLVALGLALAQIATAAPAPAALALSVRTVTNLPPSDQFITCPKYLYSRPQAEKAIQKGIDMAPKAKTKTDYPHKFGNNKKLVFSDKCKGKQLWEYPLLRGSSIYSGTGDPGADRVVFVINSSDPVKKPTSDGIYCGVMSHDGVKTDGDFAICPVKD
ncbi:Ribonuclease/ribotoxin [Lasiosphaeris hirsuta]|uniref:ribonuclease T1 n=1 Tax=Lasiosphaeris hirsuta TaxID=260670 RepID=A0AA40ANQ7_9PEZI|nr:Ribonuclease/ribotoxin [Lasiosphaeris hirsuta]